MMYADDSNETLPSWSQAGGGNLNQSTTTSAAGVCFHNEGKNFLFVDTHAKWLHVDSGPFAVLTAGPCPPAGYPGPPALETHVAGHCEFASDWPPA